MDNVLEECSLLKLTRIDFKNLNRLPWKKENRQKLLFSSPESILYLLNGQV
jgi:hypothetical protein